MTRTGTPLAGSRARAGAASVEVRLLGQVEFVVDGEPIALGGRMPRLLLARLALRANDVVTRRELVEVLWGDDPPPSAEHGLAVHVSRLRGALRRHGLEELLVSSHGGLSLVIDRQAVDALRFEDTIADGRDALARGDNPAALERLRDALGEWHGESVAGFGMDTASTSDLAHLEDLRLVALEARIDADLALGHHAALLGELHALVLRHSLHERFRAQLMVALYRSGRQAEALRVYRETRELLVEELGIEPCSELVDLERRMLRHDPSLDLPIVANPAAGVLSDPSRTNVPVPATAFVGRERELVELRALLSDSRTRLLVLTGAPGTGKTRLALRAVEHVRHDFPGGVWWVPLASLRDPALAMRSVAQTLGIPEERGHDLVVTVGERLAGRKLLVLLDNAEHLLPRIAEDVAALVSTCPGLTVVVTSRERLWVQAETVWPVAGLEPTDAVRLFVERARAAGVDVSPDEALSALCRHLDELPLAIELAAARTALFSPVQLLERLGQRLDLLHGTRDADPRQQTLRATIAWSHDLLGPVEQRLLRRLSVFAGGCTLESAERVAGADPDTLQSLLDKSLLQRRDGATGPRFWMLETVRSFAAEQLAAVGEHDEIERRFVDYFAAVADSVLVGFEGSGRKNMDRGRRDIDRLSDEIDNLRLALDVATVSDPAVAVVLAQRMVPYWWHRGRIREGRERLASVLAQAPVEPRPELAEAFMEAAQLASWEDDLDVSDAMAETALGLFRELHDDRRAGWTICQLGENAWHRGDHEKGRGLLRQALAVGRVSGDAQLVHLSLAALGLSIAAQGDTHRATKLFRGLVATDRRRGWPMLLLGDLEDLGILAEASGDAELARSSLEEAVALCRRFDDRYDLAVALQRLGHLLLPNEPTTALCHFAESLRLSREIGSVSVIAYCLEGGAAILVERGELVEAATLLGAAAAIHRRVGEVATFLNPLERDDIEAVEARCRDALGREAFTRAWEEGAVLNAAAAADRALRLFEQTALPAGLTTPSMADS